MGREERLREQIKMLTRDSETGCNNSKEKAIDAKMDGVIKSIEVKYMMGSNKEILRDSLTRAAWLNLSG